MSVKKQMDRIYGDLSRERIPWDIENPPAVLVDLVESGWVAPCDAVDLGCGGGNYTLWLASRGFRMTGLDVSPRAIEMARSLAAERNAACEFRVLDLTKRLMVLHDSFDFAFDWEVLHHIFPEDRGQYVANVHRMLRSGGRYLSVCFSEEDAQAFGGEGKCCTTDLGTTLYLSSERELRELFEPWFRIEELRAMEIQGKQRPHAALKGRMVKRG
jgi:2-polyprenyl-3-methyl-5-hydroxy-6-metoxy-1,4-benzoquinol methylase